MTNDAYWLGVAGGVLIVAVVVEMVRRRSLRGRYAVVWVVLGAGAAVLALFPDLLGRAADALGVVVPLNLLLFFGMVLMLVMIMQLSSETGRLRERTRILAEEMALMRAEANGQAPEGDANATRDVVSPDCPSRHHPESTGAARHAVRRGTLSID